MGERSDRTEGVMLADYGLPLHAGYKLVIMVAKDCEPMAYFSPWRNEFCIGVTLAPGLETSVRMEFSVQTSGYPVEPGEKIIGGGDVGAVPMFVVARFMEEGVSDAAEGG